MSNIEHKRFQVVFYDGCNGACLGEIVEGEVEDGVLYVPETEEDDRGGIVKTFVGSFTSDDGLYSNETNDVLYVPIG